MLWLYIHFPNLQLDSLLNQYEQTNTTVEKETPAIPAIIVLDTQHNQICQCNEQALAQHITIGMGLATAASLCHQLEIHDYQEHVERQRLQELAQWLYLFTGDIAVFEPDGLVLEVSSMLALYQNLPSYLTQVNELLKLQAVSSIQALAHSPIAARALARAGIQQQLDDPRHIEQQLNLLRICDLEVPAKMQDQLRRIGLSCFGEICQLPKRELGARFGLELLHYLEQMQGDIAVPLSFFQPPAHFEQNLVLHHEISQATSIQFPLKILLQRMQHYLQERALLTHSIQLTFRHRENKQTQLEIVSAEPEYQSQTWLNLSQLKLENLALDSAVIELHIAAEELVEQSAQHQDLFVTHQGEISPKQLVSRLQAKVGEQNIHAFQLHEDYRPEHAFSYQTISSRSKANPNSMPKQRWLRPSLLLEQPRPLTEAVHIIHGPERIQGSWWTEQAICRDYFVAHAIHDGQALWVFRDRDKQWFVHGLFA